MTACVVALVAALYGSAYLTHFLLGFQHSPSWNTWWRYFQGADQPAYVPFAWRIHAAGGIGIGVPGLALVGLLMGLHRRGKPRSTHGDARFAKPSDLRKAGLFASSPQGIVIGKMGRRLIRMPGQQFVILAAPTRSGKGVGVVIPNLLTYDDSTVVLDIKQENFELTSGWRASQGQEIYLFNPFAEDRRTHRWNPLSYVSNDPDFRISDLQAIAAMLWPDGSGDQKFWVSQSRNAFMAFALYLFERGGETPTLGQIYRLSSGNGGDLKPYLLELAEEGYLSSHAKTAFANLTSQAEETFNSILGSFKEPLNAFINPVLDAATSGNDFDLRDVRKKKMTIYIGILPNKLAESRVLVNLFFSQLINVNTKEMPGTNPELKHQCLLLMDEFTSIGRVDIIATAVSYMAGYNLRLLPIIQSMAQLDATYGRDEARTLMTNHALQIIYAPREQQDANDYSEMLGYTTLRRESVTRGRDISRTESEERRALMLPQELKAMGADDEVFLYEGLPHPVRCRKIRYYKDGFFTRRLRPKVAIPGLVMASKQSAPSKPTMKAASPNGLRLLTED
ncbi:type IV secretory system conjugative DNA transfer family protein [Luteibacter sp. CQ10]